MPGLDNELQQSPLQLPWSCCLIYLPVLSCIPLAMLAALAEFPFTVPLPVDLADMNIAGQRS